MKVCTTKIRPTTRKILLNAFAHFFGWPLAAHRMTTTKNQGISSSDRLWEVSLMESKIKLQMEYIRTTQNFVRG